MTLFTGKGDDGTTSFYRDQTRYSKDSSRAEALGGVDEINSLIGLLRAKCREKKLQAGKRKATDILAEIQQNLFIIQAELAGSDMCITEAKVNALGELINSIEKRMPAIKSFFVPGATELSAQFDIARAVARRAERAVIRAGKEQALSKNSQAYLNRLSSILYALARFAAYRGGVKEEKPNYE